MIGLFAVWVVYVYAMFKKRPSEAFVFQTHPTSKATDVTHLVDLMRKHIRPSAKLSSTFRVFTDDGVVSQTTQDVVRAIKIQKSTTCQDIWCR